MLFRSVKLYDKNYDEDQIVPTGRIPGPNLIRIPEMYYILAESAYAFADREKALEYLNAVVTARGLLPLSAEDIDTEAKFRRKLVGEYIKEYWGEGQIFFTYKRFVRGIFQLEKTGFFYDFCLQAGSHCL